MAHAQLAEVVVNNIVQEGCEEISDKGARKTSEMTV